MKLRDLRVVLIAVLGGAWLFLAPAASAGPPSDREQLWLQLINRFRADPVGELDRLVNYSQPGTGEAWADPISDFPRIASAMDFFNVDPAELRRQFLQLQPAPPLVWSENLHDSAEYYSGVVISRDEQSHTLDQYTGPRGLLDRMSAEGGFDFAGGGTGGENLFAFTENVLVGHAGFVLDWGFTPTGIQNPPGHRDNLLNPQFLEIGVAVVEEDDPLTDVGPLVATQHLATDFADGPFLTGAIYRDTDSNDFYSLGEGLGRLGIELQQVNTNAVAAAATAYDSGGFRMDLFGVTSGSYRLVLSDSEPIFWSGPIAVSAAGVNLAADIRDPQFDIDSISRALRENRHWSRFDLNDDGLFTAADRTFLIRNVYNTFLGDSNLDGEFNSSDLVAVFQPGEYEDSIPLNSLWSSGDWDGDGDFGTSDLVAAFQQGGYGAGPRVAARAIPEPSSLALLLVALLSMGSVRHRE